MARFHSHLAAAGLLLGLTAALATPSFAQSRVKVGMLTCRTSASIGLIVGSRQRLQCRFDADQGGRPDDYTGTISRVGLDLGFTAAGIIAWVVFAPSSGVPHGALSGDYGGASGDVSLGVGVGANALLGGSRRTIALQPLSVEAQVGVNLALGIAGMTLRSAP